MKRKDLQGLRGIAILAVTLFHFFPAQFPNGYLGVDLFFVLSGFLITMILHKSPINKDILISFYYRRMKRIIPLYYLITLMILITVMLLLPSSFIIINNQSIKNSLTFTSNIGKSDIMSYYAELTQADDLYTHTWSLSVEIQYYFLVPFLYYGVTKLPKNLHITSFAILGSLAFLETVKQADRRASGGGESEILLPEVKICELTAMLAPFPVEPNHYQLKCSATCMVLLISYFDWNVLDQSYTRIITTILAGVIIIMGHVDQKSFLTNIVLVYLGDISYSLYLVHWPVYVYIKSNYSDDVHVRLIGIIVSCIIAILITELYEKWYLQTQPMIIAILITILLILNVLCLSISLKSEEKKFALNMTEQSAFDINEAYIQDAALLEIPNCTYIDQIQKPFGWCNYTTGLNASSQYTAMILGNSYAANLGDLVWKNCGKHVKRMNQNSAIACEPLLLTHFADIKCDKNFTDFLDFVRDDPPDYLFLISRWLELTKPYIGSLDTDPYFKQANQRMVEFSKIVRKKIIILHGFPIPKSRFLQAFNKRIKLLGIAARSDDMIDPSFDEWFSRRRLEEIAKRNPKCTFIDIQNHLTWNSSFHLTDDTTGISYFTGGLHISPHGEPLIEEAFKNVCDALQ